MIWDHQDVVLFMCNLFLVFHLFILTCCVWYFALCFLVLTSPKPGLLCLVWVLVVYSVKMTFRVSCFALSVATFNAVNDCVTSVTHHPYLQGSTAPAQARRLGCSTGTFCLLSLPGSATYGRAPVGRRRTESQEDRSGAGGWWGGEKNMSTSENMNLSPIFIRPLTSFWTTSWFFFSARRRCELKCLALFSGCFHSNSNNTRQTTWKQNHTSLTHLDIWLVDM